MYRSKGRPVPQKPSIRSPPMIYQRKGSDLLPRSSRARVKEYPDQKFSFLAWLVFLATLLVIIVALMISFRPLLIDEPRTNLHRAKGKVGDDADYKSDHTEGVEEAVEKAGTDEQQTEDATAQQTIPAPGELAGDDTDTGEVDEAAQTDDLQEPPKHEHVQEEQQQQRLLYEQQHQHQEPKDNLPTDADKGPTRAKYVDPSKPAEPVLAFPKDTGRLAGMISYHQVIPDVMDQAPTALLHVWFAENKVDVGSEVQPQDLTEMPTRLWWQTTQGRLYTLVMTGLDNPSRANPIFREYYHLIIGNIEANPGGEQVPLETGDVIAEYLAPSPNRNTGLHRYIIMVFEQPRRLEFDEPRMKKTDKKRARFKTKDFAAKYSLPPPVAGIVFLSQWNINNKRTAQQGNKQG
ncbi:39S ribosomal protein L38, mitochondrial-like [Branchiostoma floridae]|uniref:39S ribosomal protein L38, mitochondrial-like n=1 Tax=Branchiostoma floridae TaxID=7739 RepID=A0A9J7L226_BRAFL|nr:39S ribosomal protein L38, mitochondrial-like [Branchiostoma floridae]